MLCMPSFDRELLFAGLRECRRKLSDIKVDVADRLLASTVPFHPVYQQILDDLIQTLGLRYPPHDTLTHTA